MRRTNVWRATGIKDESPEVFEFMSLSGVESGRRRGVGTTGIKYEESPEVFEFMSRLWRSSKQGNSV